MDCGIRRIFSQLSGQGHREIEGVYEKLGLHGLWR
jgi:hypothetical protein